MMSRRALVLLIALFAIGRSAFTQSAPDTSVCYRLAYRSGGREDPSQLFAEYIEVQTAHDRIARSGMGPGKSLEFWRMFLNGGTWEQSKDTLFVHFTNGFSGVRYELQPLGRDSLLGQVAFLDDVLDQRPPPSPVTAFKLRCEQAHLQSPAYTQADADQARRERRLDLAEVSSPLRVDQTTYRASCTQGKGEGCTYGFTLIARYENPTADTLYLARCSPGARTPEYGIVVASDNTEFAAYDPVWGCVGHDYPFVIAPHTTRVDTLKIAGPNVFDGKTNAPMGRFEGEFRLIYRVGSCWTGRSGRRLGPRQQRSERFRVDLVR